MKRFVKFGMVVLFALTAVAGCKTEEEVSVSTSAENYCSEIAEVMCHNMFECCTGAQIEEQLGIAITLDEEECKHDMTLRCEDAYATVEYGIKNGHVTVNSAALDLCLEAMLVQDECFVVTVDPQFLVACDEEMFVGNVPADSSCVYDVECADDAFCDIDQTCQPLLGAGDDCSDGFIPCAEGLFCGPNDDGDIICQSLRDEGDDCYLGIPMCEEGLYCAEDEDTGEASCRNRRDVGQSCNENEACKSGYCIPGLCAGTTDACYEDSDCQGECNESGNSCSEDADCGGECSDSGNYCDEEYPCAGTCSETGGYCEDDTDCYGGETDTCDQPECVLDTCTGASCEGSSVCADNHVVVDYCELGLGIMEAF